VSYKYDAEDYDLLCRWGDRFGSRGGDNDITQRIPDERLRRDGSDKRRAGGGRTKATEHDGCSHSESAANTTRLRVPPISRLTSTKRRQDSSRFSIRGTRRHSNVLAAAFAPIESPTLRHPLFEVLVGIAPWRSVRVFLFFVFLDCRDGETTTDRPKTADSQLRYSELGV